MAFCKLGRLRPLRAGPQGEKRANVFERYTEKARRVIFFARYEASQYGSPYIETEHLLLGLMREDKALANRFLRQQGSIESRRKEIEGRITIRERISTSVEAPLSAECKRILNMAAEEAERPGHQHARPGRHPPGNPREDKRFRAEILTGRGPDRERRGGRAAHGRWRCAAVPCGQTHPFPRSFIDRGGHEVPRPI